MKTLDFGLRRNDDCIILVETGIKSFRFLCPSYSEFITPTNPQINLARCLALVQLNGNTIKSNYYKNDLAGLLL